MEQLTREYRMSQKGLEACLELLEDVNSKLAQSARGREILTKIKEGTLGVEEAVLQLVEIAKEENLMGDLLRVSQDMMELVPGYLENPTRPLQTQTSTGINQLNPLYEAAIAEIAFLDGDVPLLRTGPLPEGGSPAVPIQTDSRDPVVVGLMLQKASEEVKEELKLAVKEHTRLCERLLSASEKLAKEEGRDPKVFLALTREKLPPVPVGVNGYEAGRLPALRSVEAPSPLSAASVSSEVRREAVYRTLTTTQGRASVSSVIEQGIREILEEKSLPLSAGGYPEHVKFESVERAWIMQVFGPQDLTDNFNPIQSAIEGLAKALLQGTYDKTPPEGGWCLKVIPYNEGIPQRRFGWLVRMGPLTTEKK